ncbi:hypothetical protein BDZ89DRAFT_1074172 [Hymenopellis radicata]|nr:hypothetical protein BDZ89DRAFT_1074172 [Hymenopellis radicata]
MAAAPKVKTFDEVFPLTLPASATPPPENTIFEGYVVPFYALGWTFKEFELWRQLAKQKEWDKRWDVFSDSQTKWVNPRWMAAYGKELPHYHRPMMYIMPNGDALYNVAINDFDHLKTFNASRQQIIDGAVDVLRLSDEKVLQLQWYRTGPYY